MGADYMDERAREMVADRLLMEQGRLAPPEDAAEQSNQREAASPPLWPDDIDGLIEQGPAGAHYTRSDDEAVVHDFGIVSNTSIGKAGKKSATWRVLEFLRDTRDFTHLRIRGEFDRIEDAREFLSLLRSNEVLDALSDQ